MSLCAEILHHSCLLLFCLKDLFQKSIPVSNNIHELTKICQESDVLLHHCQAHNKIVDVIETDFSTLRRLT